MLSVTLFCWCEHVCALKLLMPMAEAPPPPQPPSTCLFLLMETATIVITENAGPSKGSLRSD
jgi:hypothetical protein